jgi:predicted phosphoribosyltransferase
MSSLAQHSSSPVRFADRHEAGARLAALLGGYAGRSDVLVLALPRGGVPVGCEVAQRLGAPLDVFLVRKLGFPGHRELAMGAIASGDIIVLNEDLVRREGITDREIARVAAREAHEIARREREYRGLRPQLDPRARTVILVDDGLATGATMRAAAKAVRERAPAHLVIAVPVAAPDTCEEMQAAADEVVCAITPPALRAVGLWYDDFTQVTDDEVRALLGRARGMHSRAS